MLDPGFVADCPYAAEAILFDEILEIDREAGRVVARMPTHPQLPFTALQRAHPERHPRHVSGAVMVHAAAAPPARPARLGWALRARCVRSTRSCAPGSRRTAS